MGSVARRFEANVSLGIVREVFDVFMKMQVKAMRTLVQNSHLLWNPLV
jgi:hypothetical protein